MYALIEVTLKILPLLTFCISGITDWQKWTVPKTLTLKTSSQTSSVDSIKLGLGAIPAQFTSASILEIFWRIPATALSTAALSATSQKIYSQPSSKAKALSLSSSVLPCKITLAPYCLASLAVAAPMPEEEPVIKIDLLSQPWEAHFLPLTHPRQFCHCEEADFTTKRSFGGRRSNLFSMRLPRDCRYIILNAKAVARKDSILFYPPNGKILKLWVQPIIIAAGLHQNLLDVIHGLALSLRRFNGIENVITPAADHNLIRNPANRQPANFFGQFRNQLIQRNEA